MPTVRDELDELKNAINANHAEIKTLLGSLKECTCRELDELTRSHQDGGGEDTSILGQNILSDDDLDESIGHGTGTSPPDGSATWAEYDQKHCVTAYQIVWMMEQVIEMWISRYETGILFSLTAAALGIANVFGGVLKFAFKGAASASGVSLAKNSSQFLIPLSVMLTLWDDIKEMFLNVSTANIRSDFQGMKGSLICAIYCGKSPKQIGEKFEDAVDESGANILVKNVIKHLMWPELKNWVSKKGEDYEPPDFPEANCTGCDCAGEFHDPAYAYHTTAALRDIDTSGSNVTRWGSVGGTLSGNLIPNTGHFTWDGTEVGIAPGSNMKQEGSTGLLGTAQAMFIVGRWVDNSNSNQAFYDQTDFYGSLTYVIAGPGSDYFRFQSDYLAAAVFTSGERFLVAMWKDGSTSRFRVNGAEIGTRTWSTGTYPDPPIVGGIPAADTADGSILALLQYDTPLTSGQITDIEDALESLYGPFGV